MPNFASLLVTLLLLAGCASLGSDLDGLPEGMSRHFVAVQVYTDLQDLEARAGSGVQLDRNLVVTAAHVARTVGDRATVTGPDGRSVDAVVWRVHVLDEVAVLRTTRRPAVPPLRVNTSPRVGQAVIGIGLSDSGSAAVREGKVSRRRLAGEFRFGPFSFRDPVVLDMKVGPGFSGGPVFDRGGRWIGMIVGYEPARSQSGRRAGGDRAYVIPAERILGHVE